MSTNITLKKWYKGKRFVYLNELRRMKKSNTDYDYIKFYQHKLLDVRGAYYGKHYELSDEFEPTDELFESDSLEDSESE